MRWQFEEYFSIFFFKFQVWIRARKGYPIDVGDGERLFVFNVWDVALVAVN
jgi:hypothetical protein